MSEEAPEKSGIQVSARHASFLTGVLVAAASLILILIVAMFGLLVYGVFSGAGFALIASFLCLIGSIVLMSLRTVMVKVTGLQKERESRPKAPEQERQDDTLGTSSTDAKERFSEAVTSGRATYTKVKAELSARYNRAKHGDL